MRTSNWQIKTRLLKKANRSNLIICVSTVSINWCQMNFQGDHKPYQWFSPKISPIVIDHVVQEKINWNYKARPENKCKTKLVSKET